MTTEEMLRPRMMQGKMQSPVDDWVEYCKLNKDRDQDQPPIQKEPKCPPQL